MSTGPGIFIKIKKVNSELINIGLCCGTVAQVLALPPHSKKVMGSIPAWGAVCSGGQTFSAQVGYLPGLSVWSLHVLPMFSSGFLHSEPQQKNMQKNRTLSCPSLTKMEGSLHLVPGRLKSAWWPGGMTSRD